MSESPEHCGIFLCKAIGPALADRRYQLIDVFQALLDPNPAAGHRPQLPHNNCNLLHSLLYHATYMSSVDCVSSTGEHGSLYPPHIGHGFGEWPFVSIEKRQATRSADSTFCGAQGFYLRSLRIHDHLEYMYSLWVSTAYSLDMHISRLTLGFAARIPCSSYWKVTHRKRM